MLTRLSAVKSRLALTVTDYTDYDDLLTSAIKAVSDRFDKQCNRLLAQAPQPDDLARNTAPCSDTPMSSEAVIPGHRIRTGAMVVFSFCLLQGCLTAPKKDLKAETESVFAQRTRLKIAFLSQDPNKPWRVPETKRYVEGIRAIDVTRCPSDFQDAWFDYIVALERSHANDGKIDIAEIGKLIRAAGFAYTGHPLLAAATLKPASENNAQKNLKANLDDAWYHLERIAMKYGAKPDR